MTSFKSSIAIRATPEAIWSVLTNAAEYPVWNTTFTKLEGQIAPGEKLKLHVKISPKRAFPVKVVEFVPNRRMVWSDGMPFGLFKGERTYTLTPKPDGVVDFTMEEVFSGLLAPMISKSIPDMQPAFDEFAACLKKRAEA